MEKYVNNITTWEKETHGEGCKSMPICWLIPWMGLHDSSGESSSMHPGDNTCKLVARHQKRGHWDCFALLYQSQLWVVSHNSHCSSACLTSPTSLTGQFYFDTSLSLGRKLIYEVPVCLRNTSLVVPSECFLFWQLNTLSISVLLSLYFPIFYCFRCLHFILVFNSFECFGP